MLLGMKDAVKQGKGFAHCCEALLLLVGLGGLEPPTN